MQLVLLNAPGTLQQTTDVVSATAKWQLSLVYLDSIIILLRPADERIEHVSTAFIAAAHSRSHFGPEQMQVLHGKI